MVRPLTEQEFAIFKPREYILLIGSPASGKSHTVLSTVYMASKLEKARGYIIDTEGGILKLWKTRFSDLAPGKGINYYSVSSIEEFLDTFDEIRPELKAGDWLAVESLVRLWEWAQSYTYEAITGLTKLAYLEKRLIEREGKRLSSPIPQPDLFWQIAKHHYQRCFLDQLQSLPCNIMLTTTLSADKPPGMTSEARKEMVKFAGVSADGWPRGPYYPDTLIITTCERDGYYATITKDRGYDNPGIVVKFKINNFLMDYQASKGGL